VPVGDVSEAPLLTSDNAVQHDVPEVLLERGHHLGEVAGEGAQLAGLQPSPAAADHGDAANSWLNSDP
jgi:hypothetical protein